MAPQPVKTWNIPAGHGVSYGHHGEILQGAVASPPGMPRPVLVTLPCRRYRAAARFFPSPGRALEIRPSGRTKTARAVRLTLSRLGLLETGGLLVLSGNIPLRQGLGSSTADVVAAIRAVADAFGKTLTEEETARLAVKAELASDALMFEEAAVIFAHREGAVLERFEKPLPPMDLLGIRDPANGLGVSTLAGPPRRYEPHDLAQFDALTEQLRDGIARNDADSVAAVATISAHLNQRFVRKPRLEDFEELGRRYGAIGIQVAHSGTVMGLLFKPGCREAIREVRQHLDRRPWKVGTYAIPSALTTISAAVCPADAVSA